jgi:carotenoid cleavage dioxygenase
MRWDPALLAQGRVRVVFPRDVPARIGVIPQRGQGAEVRWFEAEPCYMYHAINAWEEGDEVVLVGCRIADPLVGDPGMSPDIRPAPSIGYLRLEPYLHEWRLDLRTGALRERRLDDALGEFPRIDDRRLGVQSRYVYDPHIAETSELRFDGVMKYDLETGRRHLHRYPADTFGGEVCFAPRRGAEAEDDGYLLTFLAHEATGASELLVLDARDVTGEPVARVRIPARVPTGFHAQWITADELAAQRPLT